MDKKWIKGFVVGILLFLLAYLILQVKQLNEQVEYLNNHEHIFVEEPVQKTKGDVNQNVENKNLLQVKSNFDNPQNVESTNCGRATVRIMPN